MRQDTLGREDGKDCIHEGDNPTSVSVMIVCIVVCSSIVLPVAQLPSVKRETYLS